MALVVTIEQAMVMVMEMKMGMGMALYICIAFIMNVATAGTHAMFFYKHTWLAMHNLTSVE